MQRGEVVLLTACAATCRCGRPNSDRAGVLMMMRMRTVPAKLGSARELLDVLQQVQVVRPGGSCAMERLAPMVVHPASTTGACRRPRRALVCIVDKTTNPHSCLSMTSLVLVVVHHHHHHVLPDS